MDCGRYSPGVLPIQASSYNKQIMDFIAYLNRTVSPELVSSIDRYYLIRSIWSLPRLGYTYSSSTAMNSSNSPNSSKNSNSPNSIKPSTHLIDCLLESILVSPSPLPQLLENPEHSHLQRVEFASQSAGKTQLFPVARQSPANSARNRAFPRVRLTAGSHRYLLGNLANPDFGPKFAPRLQFGADRNVPIFSG